MDGLNGFSEAIQGVFTRAVVQRCIVHMVRTSLKFVSWKDYKTVCQGLRSTTSRIVPKRPGKSSRVQAGMGREISGDRGQVGERLVRAKPFFDHPDAIRRAIYTTNPVEALHRILRKATKTKGAFISESALRSNYI
ncbi:MAG: transposase [Flavobacteriales bacterium]|nr:transposase [Flavobacteriales bacterium]